MLDSCMCGLVCATSLESAIGACTAAFRCGNLPRLVAVVDVVCRTLLAGFSVALAVDYWVAGPGDMAELQIHSLAVIAFAAIGLALYLLEHVVGRFGYVEESERSEQRYQLVSQLFNRARFASAFNGAVVGAVHVVVLAAVGMAVFASVVQIEDINRPLRGIDIAFLTFYAVSALLYALALVFRISAMYAMQGGDAANIAGLYVAFAFVVQMPFNGFYLMRAPTVRL